MGREKINRWYIGFKKVTMHVKKKKNHWRKKKLLGKKKSIQIYSMFCIIKNLKIKVLL